MKVRMPRKRVTVVVATAMALALGGGVAYAYFTAAGSGTGQASVGTSGSWTVVPAGAVGDMTPGGATSSVTFTITNAGSVDQSYTTLAASMHVGTDGVSVTNTTAGVTSDVTGCLAAWFTPEAQTPSKPVGTTIAPAGTATDEVIVTMPENITDNQDVCKGVAPDVTLSIDVA